MYEVIDWEEDVAGKFRFRVVVGGMTIVFKFHTMPSDEELQAEVARWDAEFQASLAPVEEQADGAPDPE